MPYLMPCLVLLLGAAIGALSAAFALGRRAREAADGARRDGLATLASLEERLAGRDGEVGRLRSGLDAASAALKVAESSWQAEARARAVAEVYVERAGVLQVALDAKERRIENLLAEPSRLETLLAEERRQSADKLATVTQARGELTNEFRAIAADSLASNNRAFVALAKSELAQFQEAAKGDLDQRRRAIDTLVKPIDESIRQVDAKILEMEKARVGAYEKLLAQVEQIGKGQREIDAGQNLLRLETRKLVGALGSPVTRGRWGEVQLKRVVELAGMIEHCDFEQQAPGPAAAGETRGRPDLTVRLPGGRFIVVDAKVPLQAYLESMEADDEGRCREKLRAHAGHVRKHVDALSDRAYWKQLPNTPAFVILFLPGEIFYSAALQHDSRLIEHGFEKQVIIATPTTLIALLKAVSLGWQHEAVARNAEQIGSLGKELHRRLATMGEHVVRLGKNLGAAADSYNKTVASLETRVMVQARQFRDLGAADDTDLPLLAPLECNLREPAAPELIGARAAEGPGA